MDLSEFQRLAIRTANPLPNRDAGLCNWALGLAGESGEVVELVKKHVFHGKPYKLESLKSELGDVLYYLAVLADHVGLDLLEVAQFNVDKLKERYPSGFEFGGGVRPERPDTELIHDHKA